MLVDKLVAKYQKRVNKPFQTETGLQSTKMAYELMLKYYQEAVRAIEEGRPFSWYEGANPLELLWALDIFPLGVGYMGFHSVLEAPQHIEAAEAQGFSRDTCTRALNTVGVALSEELPKPNFVICESGVCDTSLKACQYLSHLCRAPLYNLDFPHTLGPEEVAYGVKQYREMVRALEEATGKRIDWERAEELIRRGERIQECIAEINELRKVTPSPIRGRDALRLGGITREAIFDEGVLTFVQSMRDEVKERAGKGQGVVEKESYRILWLQTVFQFTDIWEYLEREFGAVIVMDELTDCARQLGRLEARDPLESLVLNRILHPWAGSAQHRVERVIQMAREYRVDGCIHFSPWGCRVTSGSARMIKDALKNELGLPTLILEGDYIDKRCYSEEEIRTRLEEFIERL